MKNLNIGITLDQVTATCNFCHEEKKECLRSPYPVTEFKEVTKGYVESGNAWSGMKSERITGYDNVKICEIDICLDCIKQLSHYAIRETATEVNKN